MTQTAQQLRYTPQEVGQALNLSRASIYRLIREGKLKALQYGKRCKVTIDVDSLQQFTRRAVSDG